MKISHSNNGTLVSKKTYKKLKEYKNIKIEENEKSSIKPISLTFFLSK